MYKPDQQWITIMAANRSGNNKKSDEDIIIDGKGSNDAQSDKSEKVISLIETFTSAIDNGNSENLESYRVKGDVGTLIAQKLIRGEKIRVCRNGEPVNLETDILEEDMPMALPFKKRFFKFI